MRKNYYPLIFPMLGMVILILDTKTALYAAASGIDLCLQTVIPSLFVFLVLSTLAIRYMPERSPAWLNPLGRLLRIPGGSEMLWVIGLLGGYPAGANMVASAGRQGRLSPQNARRMLAFCSNAGPAFIFGFGAALFSESKFCWYLWGIQILSSLIVGILMPGGEDGAFSPSEKQFPPFADSIFSATKTMAMICSWVIIFRVILSFFERWFLWTLPTWASVLLQGILELTNGAAVLQQITDESLRFCLFSLILSFGGLCVAMQTFSLCNGIDTRSYLPGKLMQALISVLLSAMFISREMNAFLSFAGALLLLCGGYYFLSKRTKRAGFLSRSAVQ